MADTCPCISTEPKLQSKCKKKLVIEAKILIATIILFSITIFIKLTKMINFTERIVQNKPAPSGDLAVNLVMGETNMTKNILIKMDGSVYSASGPATLRVA